MCRSLSWYSILQWKPDIMLSANCDWSQHQSIANFYLGKFALYLKNECNYIITIVRISTANTYELLYHFSTHGGFCLMRSAMHSKLLLIDKYLFTSTTWPRALQQRTIKNNVSFIPVASTNAWNGLSGEEDNMNSWM